MKPNLKDYLDDILPVIDSWLEKIGIPIYERFFIASLKFVEHFVSETPFSSKNEFIKSDGFNVGVVPLVNDWYHEKYKQLAKSPKTFTHQGLITIMNQPFCITFPSTISIVEKEGESSWIKFIDHLDSTEDVQKMIQGRVICLAELAEPYKTDTLMQIANVVSKIRKISINLRTVLIDEETNSMAHSILGHFEKAASDIVSNGEERIATACWEVHLAIEKVMKVYLKQKTGNYPRIHYLNKLFECIVQGTKANFDVVDDVLIASLPKNAIDLRYATRHISIRNSIDFYVSGLIIVEDISSKLDRDLTITNSSILLKKAPWAK